MNFVRTRTRLAGLTAATAATAAVLLGPAVASAGPAELAEPLLTSDCTFAQVEAALRVEAPELAQLLDANPSQKAELQRRFDQPVEQRRAEFQRLLEENPGAAEQAQSDPRAAHLSQVLAQVAATCQNY
ncbi:hemophore-related protein [Nocardia higoensis]|uniref:Hemophore-related protein n=1 Tax=Nocardia higoensis TaxID=228599 RepID=A0ABS0DC25_9NOCA|nr:hemophore-related protein [Nocardia higoensis]MBF6356020.1 hemophore-related protein [Nocardia higoensis]